MRAMILVVAMVSMLAQGCVSGPVPLSEPIYGLRKDVFNNVPVWEAQLFESLKVKSLDND